MRNLSYFGVKHCESSDFKLLYFRNETSFGDGKWAQEKNPLACLSRAGPFFLALIYFLLPATQANLRESSHVEKNSGFYVYHL